MKVLVADDTLGNPRMVTVFLEELGCSDHVKVIGSLKDANHGLEADVVIVGGHWLGRAREFRELFPHAYIIGRSPWMVEGAVNFYPWGNELRDPMLPIDALIKEISSTQENPAPPEKLP